MAGGEGGGGAGPVGILDPQQELAAFMAREQVVEQGGARPADMQQAGRRRGETGPDGHVVGHSTRPCGLGRALWLVCRP